MEDMDMYLEDLFTEAGFHPEEFEELKEEWKPVLISRILAKIALKLKPLERAQAEMYLKEGDAEKFWKLCSDNIPDYEEYFVSILEEFANDYLENFKS
jgi:hypothetical protein